MSSESHARNMAVESLRFPGEGSSAQGKSGPKPRTEVVGDGQQVYIPVPHTDRTVGTQGHSMGREWKARHKRRRGVSGKSETQAQCRYVERKKVAKHVKALSRKAAIALYAPVP